MVRFRICIVRHSKSCSNLLLERGQDGKNVRDPGLTIAGKKSAEKYSPVLQNILQTNGFDLKTTIVGASPLRRAQETAHTLFPDHTIHRFEQLSEHGHIPENIPRCTTTKHKGWNKFINWLVKTYSSESSVSVVAVGHRTFFRKEVLAPLGKDIPLSNMDGAIVEYDSDTHTTRFIKYILYGKKIHAEGDSCFVSDVPLKSDRYSSMAPLPRSRKTRRSPQRGGGLPLAYFQDGAQFTGMSPVQTGVGLAASNSSWVREPISSSQSGGGRKPSCGCQMGGYPPSVMGHFVTNGLSLLPAAGYMFYRSMKKKTLRRKKKTLRRKGSRKS